MNLKVVDETAANGVVAEIYETERQRRGYLPNYVKPFSLHPEAYAGWAGLIGSIMATMDQRRYELVTVAAARRLASTYCAMAHSKVLRDRHFADPSLEMVLKNPAEVLDPLDSAIVKFAEKVVDAPGSIEESDVGALRALGLDDREIFDVILAAAARCFFSTVIDAAGAEADAELASEFPSGLRNLLVTGRPPEET